MGSKSKNAKGDPAHARQVAALPWRDSGHGIEVMLITSRETRRLVIPKGWPMVGLRDSEAAAVEALEEAGARGEIADDPIGTFLYCKRKKARFEVVDVDVYPMRFERQEEDWKERGQRDVIWADAEDAAMRVQEPGLAAILLSLPSLVGSRTPSR